eukprot:CAMPEP_0170538322 /NCGR_PEP_ID=MMETSP0209-20121228/103234_1 /TAXON_ID=665100 ORGANISM="Litonotus pictus, Strain P1" /NCGR_SAMPLE_ID=MMETSP0209 /ASSEMBLY_ACC=CAM_ASM_000301 /LENGTH=859 /DNA_ID=CAMNT_0010839981 /DNA_START=2001 /DNA_END=4580 /DNA_ORIENTATION=-
MKNTRSPSKYLKGNIKRGTTDFGNSNEAKGGIFKESQVDKYEEINHIIMNSFNKYSLLNNDNLTKETEKNSEENISSKLPITSQEHPKSNSVVVSTKNDIGKGLHVDSILKTEQQQGEKTKILSDNEQSYQQPGYSQEKENKDKQNNTEKLNNNSMVPGDNNNNFYYESLILQPFTFVKDQKIITDNLKTGRYQKGVIRMNKTQNHAYITVPGLLNDILVRGNKNLNQAIHMDEVIVEFFPIICWKPIYNLSKKFNQYQEKSNRKESYNSSNGEGMYLPINKLEGEKHFKSKKHKKEQELLDQDSMYHEEASEHQDVPFLEKFTSQEERILYINKLYTLRPEGRIVNIVNSPNSKKPQICKLLIQDGLIYGVPIQQNIPNIFIKMKKYKREDFIRSLKEEEGKETGGSSEKNAYYSNTYNNRYFSSTVNNANSREDSYESSSYFYVKILDWAINFNSPKGIIIHRIEPENSIEIESEVLLEMHEMNFPEYPQINDNNKTLINEANIEKEEGLNEIKETQDKVSLAEPSENNVFLKIQNSSIKLSQKEELENYLKENNIENLMDEKFLLIKEESNPLKLHSNAISITKISPLSEEQPNDKSLLEIHYSIVDLSELVIVNSQEDLEARKRGVSINTVTKRINILPKTILSQAEFQPEKTYKALTHKFRIFENGDLDYTFTPCYRNTLITIHREIKSEEIEKLNKAFPSKKEISKQEANGDIIDETNNEEVHETCHPIISNNSVQNKRDFFFLEENTESNKNNNPGNNSKQEERKESVEEDSLNELLVLLIKTTKTLNEKRIESGALSLENKNFVFEYSQPISEETSNNKDIINNYFMQENNENTYKEESNHANQITDQLSQ